MSKPDPFKLDYSDSEDSDAQPSEQHTLSDNAEEPSPSQYRLQRAQEDEKSDESEEGESSHNSSEHSQDEWQSASSSDEDHDAISNSTPAAPPSSLSAQDQMFSQFAEMTRQFSAMVEQNRRMQLMSRKSARQSLDFDSPKRKRAAPLSPKKKRGRDTVADMQEQEFSDCDRDSLLSSRTTRKRLQRKYRVVGDKPVNSASPSSIKEWIHKHAVNVMAQSGNMDDIACKDKEYGGFKRVQVCPHNVFLFSVLTSVAIMQVYQSMSKRAKGYSTVQYHCPYRYKCGCYVALKVQQYPDRVVLLQSGEHTLDSHVGRQRGKLSVKQRGAVKRAARAAPLAVGKQIHDGLLDLSPGKHIPFDRSSQRAVARLVRKTRKDVMAERLQGIEVDDTEGSMNRLAESLSLSKFLERHNNPGLWILCSDGRTSDRKVEGAPHVRGWQGRTLQAGQALKRQLYCLPLFCKGKVRRDSPGAAMWSTPLRCFPIFSKFLEMFSKFLEIFSKFLEILFKFLEIFFKFFEIFSKFF